MRATPATLTPALSQEERGKQRSDTMSLFLTDPELTHLSRRDATLEGFYWHLLGRASEMAAIPGLGATHSETWWHEVLENVATVAAAVRLKNEPGPREWIRSTALTLAGLPQDAWIGPWFRDHARQPPVGHLETAHVSMALALALDLGRTALSEPEQAVVAEALRAKGIALCRAWLAATGYLANWRCVLLAGVTVPAAVLGDRALLEECLAEYRFCCQAFQADGSYGESLQYASYAAWALMMTHESLLRALPPEATADLPMPYAGLARWAAYSLFARRPLSGWGDLPRPLSLNFNDSGLIAGIAPDLLLHIAVRARERDPETAALARHAFDTVYADVPNLGPFHRSSFGFLNTYSFLTLALHAQAGDAQSPTRLNLAPTARFSAGPAIARSGWEALPTVLAVSGVPDPLHCTGHLHADLNSVILAYRGEVFLADPGHSCYRNVIHEFETSTRAHNTCTFVGPGGELQQRTAEPRRFSADRRLEPPVTRPGRHLLSARLDDVSVFANDAAAAYGEPVDEFTRVCILTGGHAVFVVDTVSTSVPMRAKWNWLANNRDGMLEAKVLADRRVLRRGSAGMKMFFHSANPLALDRKNGYVHDCYDPLPGQPGEGKNGTGLYLNVLERTPAEGRRTVVHAFALDDFGASAGWHFKQPRPGLYALEGPGARCRWELAVGEGHTLVLTESTSNRTFRIGPDSQGIWQLTANT